MRQLAHTVLALYVWLSAAGIFALGVFLVVIALFGSFAQQIPTWVLSHYFTGVTLIMLGGVLIYAINDAMGGGEE